MTYSDLALRILKGKGFRVTRPRRLVVEILAQADEALSAYEIKDLLQDRGERVDTVSVYRIIECLEENHLVHRLLGTGKIRKCQLPHEDHCTLERTNHCHHLLICQSCGDIQEIHCLGLGALIKDVEKQARFKIKEHNLEFIGLCPKCA